MTYEEFLNFVPSKCMHETIYDDSEGNTILVIRLLDAFSMVNKAQRPWVGLTDDEIQNIVDCGRPTVVNIRKAEQLLKDKNT
jgi:hypothetical protein